MRLLELYTSVQGEGPNVGKPTTFVRFAGCNLRCPGWPCDTPYSIEPEIWQKEFVPIDAVELYTRILAENPKHVCITGGEPLIQPRAELVMLLANLLDQNYTIDIFTNGTMPIIRPEDPNLTYVLDWKLAGSGEGHLQDKLYNTRFENLMKLFPTDAIKFTVKDRNDMYEARDLINQWKSLQGNFSPDLPLPKFYMGPVWDKVEPSEIVEFLADNGLWDVFLNLQVHKVIWDPKARRI